jgi:membrane fusion protein, multidrug efflux system
VSALRAAIILFSLAFIFGCSKGPEKKPPPPPLKVTAATIVEGELQQALAVSGTLKFSANTTVSAEISAQVKTIEVSDGQFVDRGQVLLIFDETQIRELANQASANLQKNEATLGYNRIEWEKNKILHDTGSISNTQYEQKLSIYQTSLAQVEADKAVLANALEDLKKTKVMSPISGVLSKRYIERGDWTSKGNRLFQVSDYDKVYLETFLSDLDLGKLPQKKVRSEGVPAEVQIDSFPGRTFSGNLTYIQPVAQDSRLFETRIYMDNPEMELLQGMVGRAEIIFKTNPGVILAPLSALLEELRVGGKNTVFVVDNQNIAERVPISVGNMNQRFAEVLEGLKTGDIVVVNGKELLTDGRSVQILSGSQQK